MPVDKASRIRAVHAACKAQGIDDTQRRAIQLQITGKASLTEMGLGEIGRLLSHLNRGTGKRPANPWAFVFRLPPERRQLAQKLYRLAQRIGALQQPPLDVMPLAYMNQIARRMLGMDKPEFDSVWVGIELADETTLYKIMQAMAVYLQRHAG